jgi:hypothetical protein
MTYEPYEPGFAPSLAVSTFCMAAVTSFVVTMWYRTNTARVLCPLIGYTLGNSSIHEIPHSRTAQVVNNEPSIFIPCVAVLRFDQDAGSQAAGGASLLSDHAAVYATY